MDPLTLRIRQLCERGHSSYEAVMVAGAEDELRRALRHRHEVVWPRCTDAQASAKERARCRLLVADIRERRRLLEVQP